MTHLICLATAIITLVACSQSPHDSELGASRNKSRVHDSLVSPPVVPASDSGAMAGARRVLIGSVYVCGWHPHPPKERVILADIFLSRFTDTRPTRSEVDSVRALGGEVRYVFHVPIVRAQIERNRVPALVESGFARMVTTVSDPYRRDLGARIFFTRPAQGSDADRVTQLGGDVEWRPDPVNDGRRMMDALLPDSAVPYIRAIPGFERIGFGGACGTLL